MANRSDFAQKLLNDLRMRKERMDSSNRSNQMSTEKYRYFKQTSKGSREIKPSQTIGPTTRDSYKWLGSSNRKLSMEGSSSAIVPLGRSGSSGQIGDLSMAIAFALQNGGELKKMGSSGNSMAGFLNQFGQRSLDFREMDKLFTSDRGRPPNGGFPTLSNLQIKEISRGAQKLNQILKLCNNGLNFDNYTIDIGKELLKGSIDLEESLRILVSLQEDSEYIVTPRRKQKIRLVEVDDDDDEIIVKVSKQKQLDRPKFSFDRPSRNTSDNVGGANKSSAVKQKLLALSYYTEAPHANSEKQSPTASKIVSHGRSASFGPGYSTIAELSSAKKHSSSSGSQPERGRIPNVIAKLMGLEELPAKIDSKVGVQKDRHGKQETRAREDSRKNSQGSTKKLEQVATDSKMQANRSSSTKEIRLVPYGEKTKANQLPSKTGLPAGEPHPKTKSTENINPMSNSKVTNFKTDTPQSNLALSLHNAQTLKDKPEMTRRPENPTPKEQKSSGRAETRDLVFRDDLHRMRPRAHEPIEAADNKQENAPTTEVTHQKGRKNANNRLLMPSNRQKPLHDSPSRPPNKLRKSESHAAKLQNAKSQLQMKNPKGNEKIMKNLLIPMREKKLPHINYVTLSKEASEASDAMPSKESLLGSHHEKLSREENSTNLKNNMKKSPTENSEEKRPPLRDTEIGVKNVAALVPPVAVTNPVPVFPKQNKTDNTQEHKTVNLQKIGEVTIKENGSHSNMAKPQQISDSQEPKPRSLGGINSKEEASISRSKEAEASTEPKNLIQDLQQDTEVNSMRNPIREGFEMLNESPNSIIQEQTTKVSTAKETSIVSHDEDQARKSSNIASVQLKGLNKSNVIGVEEKQPETVKSETPRLLTEDENHLKQILIKSQLFVNAAEALFKLQIPAAILHASANKYHDEDSKLVLDCSYEVMKRKGRRQEFIFHPRASVYVGSKRIKCLDDLVKELQEEIETLKFCTKQGSNERDAADCLHAMLEKDIQNRNPDVNSAWDSGWNETMFAYVEKEEVLKDVEKHVLNGLLDEITREFLHVSVVN